MKIFTVIREISDFFFIGRTLRKASKTEKWKKFSLRRGWFNVAFTVINLPPEVYESEEIYYRTYVIEEVGPINEYFKELNLAEVVSVETTDISNKEQGVYAFLIKYEPLFKVFSLWWIIKWTIAIGLIWWVIARFDLFSYVVAFFHWIKL